MAGNPSARRMPAFEDHWLLHWCVMKGEKEGKGKRGREGERGVEIMLVPAIQITLHPILPCTPSSLHVFFRWPSSHCYCLPEFCFQAFRLECRGGYQPGEGGRERGKEGGKERGRDSKKECARHRIYSRGKRKERRRTVCLFLSK